MEVKTQTIGKKLDGKQVTITRQVDEILTEQDIIQKKNQLQMQQTEIKRQMQILKDKYSEVEASIAEYDEALQQFSNGLPDIE